MSDHACCSGCLECAYVPKFCCHVGFMIAWWAGEAEFMGIRNEGSDR